MNSRRFGERCWEPTPRSRVRTPLQPPTRSWLTSYRRLSFFERPPILEEMVRAEEFLRLMRGEQLRTSDNYVPVDEWLRQRA